jgi:outer membrane lipoprotein-sorting protein
MSRASAGLLFCLIASFSLAAPAQNDARTADEVIARHLEAEGGAAKLKAQNTMRIIGYAEAPGFRADFMEAKKRPNQMRRELRLPNNTLVEAYDGEKGWQVTPGKSGAQPVEGAELQSLQEDVDFDGPLMDYRSKGNKIELVGKEKFAGATAYRLRVTLSGGSVRNYYISANTFLGAGMSGKSLTEDKETDFDVILTDFHDVNGIKVPFKAQHHSRTAAGEVTLNFTFATVEYNVPLDDGLFKMPDKFAGQPKEATAR